MTLATIETLMKEGKWDEAIAACYAVLQIQPTNARLHGYLGMCHFRQNCLEKAESSFRKATQLDPSFWEVGIRHAQCLDRMQKYTEAYAVASEWLRMRPGDKTLQGLVTALEGYSKKVGTREVKGLQGYHTVLLSAEERESRW